MKTQKMQKIIKLLSLAFIPVLLSQACFGEFNYHLQSISSEDKLAHQSIFPELKEDYWKWKIEEFLSERDGPNYEREELLDNWEGIKSILTGKAPSPRCLEIMPTTICNLRCEWCRGGPRKCLIKNHTLPKEKLINLVDDAISLGVKEIRFSGFTGEPLIKDCYEGVLFSADKAIKAGLKVRLITNGTLLDEGAREVFVNAQHVNISLDGTSKKSYWKLKGVDRFNTVLRNIRALAELKRQKKTNVSIRVSFIIHSSTIDEVEKITQELKQLGVDQVIFKMAWGDNELTEKRLEEIYSALEVAKNTYSDSRFKFVIMDSLIEAKNIISSQGIKPDYNRCPFAFIQPAVFPDGKITPCCHYQYNNLPNLGDLDNESFKTIWLSTRLKKEIHKINPARDCQLCFRPADRLNRFLIFLSREATRDPKFINWLEEELLPYMQPPASRTEIVHLEDNPLLSSS